MNLTREIPSGFLFPLARAWLDTTFRCGLAHAGCLTRVASSMARRGMESRGLLYPLARRTRSKTLSRRERNAGPGVSFYPRHSGLTRSGMVSNPKPDPFHP